MTTILLNRPTTTAGNFQMFEYIWQKSFQDSKPYEDSFYLLNESPPLALSQVESSCQIEL